MRENLTKADSLKAGFGRADITPPLGVRLGGYPLKERPAEEILDRLHATALALAQGSLQAVIISLDWLCVDEMTVKKIRDALAARTGIQPAQVMVAATHTHSAPNTVSFFGWGEAEAGYIEMVLPEIVCAVEQAMKALQPVQVGFAATESLVGINRRKILENGEVGLGANPYGPFDPTMTVVHFRDFTGKDSGVLVHYGAHGTAMSPNKVRAVSRDWIGVMKDRIESQFHAPVLFLNGALGDVAPRTNEIGNKRLADAELHALYEVGYRAATDAIRALLSIHEWRRDLYLKILIEEIFLPYAPLKPLAEAEADLEKWRPAKDQWGNSQCEYLYNQAVIEAHRQPPLTGRAFMQTITAFGSLAIVPMPGEAFSEISLRIRRDSPFQYTLCCSLANGCLSYLPSREARQRGGYEIRAGRALGAYLLAENIDDVLVAENLKLLRKLSAVY